MKDWLYYKGYRAVMKLAHRFHWHYAPPCYPEGDTMLWCHWCGLRQVVKRARSSHGELSAGIAPAAAPSQEP
jgi:hypothetical protein